MTNCVKLTNKTATNKYGISESIASYDYEGNTYMTHYEKINIH